jgi:hypothetical protein
MSQLVALIKFIFKTGLLLIGVVIVVAVVTSLPAFFNTDTARLLIDPNSAWPFTGLGAEAGSLYPILQARVNEINTPISNDPSLTPFNVAPGETAVSVAQDLQGLGLIRDAELFVYLLRYNGLDTRLQAGAYQLRRNMTMRQIAAALYRGRSAQLIAIVPPGWRMEQLAAHLTANEIMDGNFFLQQARQGTVVSHPLLADRPPGQSYEGYLFPGTYPLPDRATPADLIIRMLNNMAGQLPPNVITLAQQRGLTFYQVLTLASIVERETALQAEKPFMASVYLNRLSPNSPQPLLQSFPARARDHGAGACSIRSAMASNSATRAARCRASNARSRARSSTRENSVTSSRTRSHRSRHAITTNPATTAPVTAAAAHSAPPR